MKKERWQGLLVTAIMLPLLIIVLTRFVFMQTTFFCAPSAFLASVFFSAPLQTIDNGYRIALLIPIEVTTACSAIKFFTLTFAVFCGFAVERRISWRHALFLLPFAYLLTLGANSCRIICTWYSDSMAAYHLPKIMLSGIHALVGALVFMTALSAGYYYIWRLSYDSEKAQAAT